MSVNNTTKNSEIPLLSNIKEILYNSVDKYKDNIAFTIKIKKGENVEYINKTYESFLNDINSFGASLYCLGLKSGRVAIMGKNRYEWAVAYLSNLLGGIISIPIDKDLQLGELEDSLIRSKAKALVFDKAHKELIDEIKKRN